jgi:hypothetical protein
MGITAGVAGAAFVGALAPLVAIPYYGPLIVYAVVVLISTAGLLGGLLAAAAGAAVVISATTGTMAAIALSLGMITVTATGAGALTAAAGPLLLKAAKQMELAVVNAVNLALLGHTEDLPPRLLPERDYSSVDLDTTYAQVTAGGWLMLAMPEQRDVPEQRKLFYVERAEERTRAEFLLSSRVTRVKLRGSGLAGPFKLTREDIERLKEQGLPEKKEEGLRVTVAGRKKPMVRDFWMWTLSSPRWMLLRSPLIFPIKWLPTNATCSCLPTAARFTVRCGPLRFLPRARDWHWQKSR